MRRARWSVPLATTDRGGVVAVVLEGDREVGRVGHDDVGGRDRVHHAGAGELHRAAALGALDLGRELLLLVLLLDLLLVHLEVLLEAVLLVEEVGGGDRQVGERAPLGDAQDQRAQVRQQRLGGHADQRGHLVELGEEGERDDAADGADLEHALDRLGGRVHAEDVLGAGERVELLEVGRERLRRGLEADLERRWRRRRRARRSRSTGTAARAMCMPTVMNSSVDALAVDDLGRGDELEHAERGLLHPLEHRRAEGREARARRPSARSRRWRPASGRPGPSARASWRFLGVAFSVLFVGHG